MNVSIRQATLEDAALLALLNYSVHEIHVAQMPARYKPTRRDSPEVRAAFVQRLQTDDRLNYIAEVAGTAVGYIACERREVEDNPFTQPMTVLYIDQMGVEAAYRGQGVGSALLKFVEQVAREQGIDTLTLGVAAFNDGALRLYERHGFVLVSLRLMRKISDE